MHCKCKNLSKQKLNELLPVHKPATFAQINVNDCRITWIGHSTLVIQIETISILTDPLMDQLGTRPPACNVDNLPDNLRFILISHNHRDHLDYQSVCKINDRFGTTIKWLVPMNLKRWFTALDINNVIEFDWWQEKFYEIVVTKRKIKFVFTPSQHCSGRNLWDLNKSLWGGWCIIGEAKNVFFAGDTGYHRELFEYIGDKYGPFSAAAIPIGAYEPRNLMYMQNVSPIEAIEIHKCVKSMYSIGIHWGTLSTISTECFFEPKFILEKEAKKSRENFECIDHGNSIILL